jgi:long-chain fatty acid transport protein
MSAAFAGRAAASANASVLYWNPAGMARLKDWNYNIGAHYIDVSGELTDEGSTSAAGTPMLGDSIVDGGTSGIIPNLYVTKNIGEKWVLGIGVNAPFALATEYPDDSFVRYQATKSEILVINIEPAVSYRINEQWSIGLGLNLQHVEGELSNQIDFGSIGAGLEIPGMIPQALDGSVRVTGDGFGIGGTLGVMYEINDKHRLGLSYRSQVKHTLEGEANFKVPDGASDIVDMTGFFVDSDVELDLTLPDKIIFSGYHQLHPQWAFVWDVAWTNWSTVEEIRIKFDSGQPDSVLKMDWDSTFRVSVGAIWDLNQKWTFRAGLAWDQSPIPDSTRGPRLPGNDRFWLAAGFSYKFNQYARMHLSYFHIFIEDGDIDHTASAATGNILASTEGSADAISLGVTGTW